MEFSPLIAEVFKLWFFIPILILIGFFKTPWFKGVIGEFVVNLSIKLQLDKTKYHLVKNVTLPTEDGTTQIDHIIVSQYGLFVVETKNMKGWIFGSANQSTWTQQIYKHKNKFQNPLRQNYKHLKILQSLLELDDKQIHSVIVFIGNSTFKKNMPPNVTKGGGYIKFVESKTDVVLSDEQVNAFIEKIEEGRLTQSFKTNREHVKHVRSIVSNKESTVTGPLPTQGIRDQNVKQQRTPREGGDPETSSKQCPKCNSKMVLRTAKKGSNAGNKFWGCSQYPRCRAIVN